MTFGGGVGDDLSVEEQILRRERLFEILARERTTNSSDTFDDVVQEQRITTWQVLTRRPHAPVAYLTAAARHRATEVASRGKWTGMPSQRGKPSVDPLRRSDRDSLDVDDDSLVVLAADLLSGVELAYHHGEIMDAIASLPLKHRQYVMMRFWGGMTPAEISPYVGVKSSNLARMWTDSIRPPLLAQLAHLEGAS